MSKEPAITAPGRTLPGYQPVNDPEVRARFENRSRVTLSTTKGLDNHDMIDAIREGHLRAMYLCGEELALVDSNINHVAAAFQKLDFFVVQDVFFSETCRFADVVLNARKGFHCPDGKARLFPLIWGGPQRRLVPTSTCI